MSSARMLVGLLAMLAACDQAPDHCTEPDQTIYSCEPVPAGQGTCAGGPRWTPYNNDGVRQDDTQLSYPDMCSAHVPECSAFYQDSRRTFQCFGGRWGELL
ncbi:MAG: hypothetical protein SFX73_20495 [Kofleriaceae bacterium]|nr:hypothetical protein [Kofleriaceae bacterium]